MPGKGQSDHDCGYIYIMPNPSNPNSTKIGLSRDPFERAKNLSNTSQPSRFNPLYIWMVNDMKEAETQAHKKMEDRQTNPKREFFNLVTKEESLSGDLPAPTEYNTQDPNCPAVDLLENYNDTFSQILEETWREENTPHQLMNIEAMKKESEAAKKEKRKPRYRIS